MSKGKASAAAVQSKQSGGQTQEGGTTREKPAHTCQIGRMRGVVWANKDKDGNTWYSVNLTRSYKDGNGEWKTATSMGRDDLLVGAEILRLCWLFVAQQHGSKLDGNGHHYGTTTETSGSDIPF